MTTKLKTIDIKGTAYATVNTRLKYFRENFEDYRLTTEILSNEGGKCLIKASISNDKGDMVATGHAYEVEGEGFINKTSHVENCETSAWGRALGNFGIGIDAAVASYEEVANAIKQQAEPKKKRVKDSVAADIQTIKKEDLEIMLQECPIVKDAIAIWWLLTKEQQEDKDIKFWFEATKDRLGI